LSIRETHRNDRRRWVSLHSTHPTGLLLQGYRGESPEWIYALAQRLTCEIPVEMHSSPGIWPNRDIAPPSSSAKCRRFLSGRRARPRAKPSPYCVANFPIVAVLLGPGAMQPVEHHGHGPIYECGSGKAFVRAGSRPGNDQACSAVHRSPCGPGVRGAVGIVRIASNMESHG
jgi:hypothetical protein